MRFSMIKQYLGLGVASRVGNCRRMLSGVLLVCAVLVVSACGFHFESYEQLRGRWQVVHVESKNATAFDQRLIQKLSDLGVEVKEHLSVAHPSDVSDGGAQVHATGVHLFVGNGKSSNNQTLGDTTETRLYTYSFSVRLHLEDAKAHHAIDKIYMASTEVQFSPNQMRLSSMQLIKVQKLLYDQVINQFFSDAVSGITIVAVPDPIPKKPRKPRKAG